MICRDRFGGYAEGSRKGAPQAVQVADRFHLWQNLGHAVEKTANAYRANLAASIAASAATDQVPPELHALPEKKIVTRMREQYAAVEELWAQGTSKAAIGRKLSLHPATVRKFVQAPTVDDVIAKTDQRAHVVDPYVGHLHHRWNEGERNATQLFREIAELGHPGGELAVQRYLRSFRHGRGHAPDPGPKPPSVRQVACWIMTHPDHLTSQQTARLQRIRDRDQHLDRLTAHVRSFAVMMTNHRDDQLESWITGAERDTLPPLASFARNLRRDYADVLNGLAMTYSSGPAEGNIKRLKMLKRQMFGRATAAAAAARFDEFADRWGAQYPAVVRLWQSAWDEFIPFLDYDVEIRRILCSTNAIESLNARYRRAVRARGHFPTEQAALKCVYVVTRSLDPTGRGKARWAMRWKPALNAFAITFAGRILPSGLNQPGGQLHSENVRRFRGGLTRSYTDVARGLSWNGSVVRSGAARADRTGLT